MKIYQSSLFARKVKKFHYNQKIVLDKEILKIIDNPKIGVEKKGDLKGVFVCKFIIMKQPYLLSYRKKGRDLELITLGPHENYYRDLKSFLKST